MENFIKQHDECKQVSTTGARALIVLVALAERPRTFEEIRDFLISTGLADKKYSIDTIRIDIRTLKAVGCDISKATKTNGHRYSLLYHPFRLFTSDNEIDALKRVYKRICRTASPGKLLEYHYLFNRLAGMIDDEKIKEKIYGISILKSVNIELLEKLVKNEKKHNKLRILYQPQHRHVREYDITIEKLAVRSERLYVYCYNHSNGKQSFLNVSWIKDIISSMFDKESTRGLDICVKFKLKNHEEYLLEENETLLEENREYAIIEGRYFNEFIAIQRMLSFGPDCIVMHPQEIKSQIIQKLKDMREVYG